ncbi:hypothetical protein [Delftia acidovorans]|uniref:hypothetical protein n=1 Tax=Delftia acidovorans TaxID=80866 RepID=UPI00333EBD6D
MVLHSEAPVHFASVATALAAAWAHVPRCARLAISGLPVQRPQVLGICDEKAGHLFRIAGLCRYGKALRRETVAADVRGLLFHLSCIRFSDESATNEI